MLVFFDFIGCADIHTLSVTVTGPAGYSYSQTGSLTVSLPNASAPAGLCPGTYTVTGSVSNGRPPH